LTKGRETAVRAGFKKKKKKAVLQERKKKKKEEKVLEQQEGTGPRSSETRKIPAWCRWWTWGGATFPSKRGRYPHQRRAEEKGQRKKEGSLSNRKDSLNKNFFHKGKKTLQNKAFHTLEIKREGPPVCKRTERTLF